MILNFSSFRRLINCGGVVVVLAISSCNVPEDVPDRGYTLENIDGILIEKFPTENTLDTRFTDNNKIYRAGFQQYFAYEYVTRQNDTLYFMSDTDPEKGVFDRYILVDSVHEEVIRKFSLRVTPGLAGFSTKDDYNQSVIKYTFFKQSGERLSSVETTGLVENEKNIWFHPPRTQFFKIMEITPFPYVVLPVKQGATNNLSLTIGDFWSTELHPWEGALENKATYEVTGRVANPLSIGSESVWSISASATSKLGTVTGAFLYDEEAGFVMMNYRYPNGDRLKVWCTEFFLPGE